MPRLIDADALLEECKEAQKSDPNADGRGWANHFLNAAGEPSTEWYCVEDMIENAPTQEVNGLQGTVAAQRVWFCGGQLQINKNTFNDWAKRIHEIAVSHGWWESEDGKCDDGDRPFPEIVALCHSELSEALEEYRNDKPMAYQVQSYGIVGGRVENDPAKWFPASKPEGIAVEMIDCVIRILDWMGHEGIDVDTLMEKKAKYNEGRKHRHGGKKA